LLLLDLLSERVAKDSKLFSPVGERAITNAVAIVVLGQPSWPPCAERPAEYTSALDNPAQSCEQCAEA
jgi:hypothetical protein